MEVEMPSPSFEGVKLGVQAVSGFAATENVSRLFCRRRYWSLE